MLFDTRGARASLGKRSEADFAQRLGLYLVCFLPLKNKQEKSISLLKELPEYKEAMKIGVGPKIFVGSPENRVGKIAISEITGGTEGSVKMYEKMSQAGIGTVIAMHTSEEHRKEAEAAHINIVIAGHMSSDSLGVNLMMDELEKKGIEIVPCSGFTRFSRVSKKK